MPEFCKTAPEEQNIGKINEEIKKQGSSEGKKLTFISSLILCSIIH